ncbi:hypothetical protein UVI_02010080 [Ustilaginoidea virens]|uniref:Peroxidase n=1 Tax=Ustilaginoidea virens TaxID=1159556 RepID=A0A1B5KXK3_USTVR|nr:hypothetical protein UVI_02010080 [Ustilaginoidea virens]
MWALAISVLLYAASAQAKYVWPAKSDFLEDMLAIQSGAVKFGFTDLVGSCDLGFNQPGRQSSAEWVRAAFHDAITHNKAKGTGGLDISIMFETERPENKGVAFNNTLNDMHSFFSPRASGSDLLALALVAAVAGCGGPRIQLRMGRIDASAAGPAGVPEPEHDLASTLAAFTNAGFSQEDMIAMVACGHTLGGVQSVDFPDITGGTPSNSHKVPFDRTAAAFDTAVVNEYLQGDGVNPLVFGHNQTTNSDKRIFAADGNATMSRLRDPQEFRSTCGTVFQRLIDTVPSTVQLSEPIDIVDVKPYIDKLELATTPNQLALAGKIRVRTTKGTGRDADSLQVSLRLLDRSGKSSHLDAPRMRWRSGQSEGFFGETFTWYEFATQVDAVAGLKSFTIHLKDASGAEPVHDNGGHGYPLNDQVLYMQSRSCQGPVANGNMTFTIGAAVRKSAIGDANDKVAVKMAHKIHQTGAVLPRIVIQPLSMVASGISTAEGYVHYSLNVSTYAPEWSTTFDIELQSKKGTVASEFHPTVALENC